MIAIAAAKSESTNPQAPAENSWQASLLQLLPAIQRHARIAFGYLPAESREEHIQEVTANALVAYVRLVKLGKQDLAYAGPLAKYAVAQVRSGRRVGGRLNVQDVMSQYCKLNKGVKVDSLDRLEAGDA